MGGLVKTEDGGGIMLKLNAREILKLAGQELLGSDSQVAADHALVAVACHTLAKDTGCNYICFTDGPFASGMVDVRSKRRWCFKLTQPLRGPIVSPIGAGDSTSAGTLHAWNRACKTAATDDDRAALVADAFRFGLAVGSASCLTGENA